MIEEKAYAKLNISLDVLSKREDGYHDLRMIMQSISLCDNVMIEPDTSGIISASSNFGYIPGDIKNLAVAAASMFFEKAGIKDGLKIRLEKSIPVGSGMAGGSSDAAAVLRALDRLYPGALNKEQLFETANKVGSDVAFCLEGGTCLAEGRGEKLCKLPPLPDCRIAVCKPSFSLSTPEMYRRLDRIRRVFHPDTDGIITALGKGDLPGVSRRMYNVFEDVGGREFNTVKAIKSVLLEEGALGSVMTGSGSAVFGIFDKEASAVSAVEKLRKMYPFSALAAPVNF